MLIPISVSALLVLAWLALPDTPDKDIGLSYFQVVSRLWRHLRPRCALSTRLIVAAVVHGDVLCQISHAHAGRTDGLSHFGSVCGILDDSDFPPLLSSVPVSY
jgi:hypothetical protein